jgi:hypothetical protein
VAKPDNGVKLCSADGPERPSAVVEEGQQHVRAAQVARDRSPGRAVLGRLVAALVVDSFCPVIKVGARATTTACGWTWTTVARAVEAERLAVRQRLLERLGETGPLNQGVQARRQALRTRHINGVEVRKKRPMGLKIQEEAQGIQANQVCTPYISPCRAPRRSACICSRGGTSSRARALGNHPAIGQSRPHSVRTGTRYRPPPGGRAAEQRHRPAGATAVLRVRGGRTSCERKRTFCARELEKNLHGKTY